MQPSSTALERAVRVLGALATTLAIVAFVSITAVDPDLWGHVLYGLDILREKAIVSADPYSFTSDKPWINHEWLSELVMGLAFRVGGTPGLVGLKVGLIALTVVIVYRTARLRSDVATTVYLALMLLVSVFPLTQTIRPQLFSLLAFAAMLGFVARYLVSKRPSMLMPVPAVLCLWANSHGGWVVGEAALWMLLATRLPFVSRREAATLGLVLLASALAPLLNPYGTGLYTFLASTLSVARPEIGEWGSIWTFGIAGLLPWAVVSTVAAYAFRHGFVRRHPIHAVAIVMFAVLSMRVVRLVGFYGMATCVLLSLDAPRVPQLRLTAGPPQRRAQAMITAAFFCLISLGAVAWTARSFTCLQMTGDWRPVAGDVRYLREVVKGGRLVTWFNWGQYAIWHLAPQFQVSIDGRRETVYSEQFLRRHFAFYRAEPGWEDFLRETNADVVWLPDSVPIVERLQSAGWRSVHRTAYSAIFVRPGSSFPPLAAESARTDSCFPRP